VKEGAGQVRKSVKDRMGKNKEGKERVVWGKKETPPCPVGGVWWHGAKKHTDRSRRAVQVR